jgi:hypothetical protein
MDTLRRLGRRWQKPSVSAKARGKGQEEKPIEFDDPEDSLQRQCGSSDQAAAYSSDDLKGHKTNERKILKRY